jgi:NAD(P)-dependent dehydrogenase (short-subunit alcohol dehydrogenase family)
MKKNVLISGAGGQLGSFLVNQLKNQYHILAAYSPGKSKALPGVTSFECDTTDEGAVNTTLDSVFSQHPNVYAGILTVGGYAQGTISETSGHALRTMISLNFESAYFMTRKLFANMEAAEGGKIILIGARPALQPSDGKSAVAYALSKSLIFKLAELLNAAGKEKHIVCSVLVPSVIDTPANRAAMPNHDFSKWVNPEEIAATVSFLLSDEAKSLRDPVVKLYGDA